MILLIVDPRSSGLTVSKLAHCSAPRVAVPSPGSSEAAAASLGFLSGGSVAPLPGHPRLARAPWALQTRTHPRHPRQTGARFVISFRGAMRHDHNLETCTRTGNHAASEKIGQ